MNFKGLITITRNSNDEVNIRLKDSASRTEFVDVSLSLRDYALLLTGLSHVEVAGEVRGLDKVGKTRVTERRSITCPIESHDKKALTQWLIDNCQEDGWQLDSYLGSQGSVVYKDGVTVLNYSVTKYVEED